MVDDHGEPTSFLASDSEREQSVQRLRDALVEGRLTLEEFSDRVGRAQAARTDRDLAALSHDLPSAVGAAQVQVAATAGLPAVTVERHRAVCSHLVRTGPWSLPIRSAWRSIFGTIELDLREARLASTETVLEVDNLFGTVTIRVPEGVDVTVTGGGPFATQQLELPTPTPDGARLRIETRGVGGTLRVRASPTLKESLAQSLKDSVRRALTR